MSELIEVKINGQHVRFPAGTTVAVALMINGNHTFRRSVSGEGRGPLCGMGICFECRATIDGQSQSRTCQTACRPGMEISTDER